MRNDNILKLKQKETVTVEIPQFELQDCRFDSFRRHTILIFLMAVYTETYLSKRNLIPMKAKAPQSDVTNNRQIETSYTH